MKIIDLKCSSIEGYPTLRIDTDEGISGISQIEFYKNEYIIPNVLIYKSAILGMDPTNVERVMLRIRHLGSFKPWGSAVSAIEMALWDIAGKALGVPVYRLLGGKIRDKVRVYDTIESGGVKGDAPEDYAEATRAKKLSPEGFTIIKNSLFLNRMLDSPGYVYGESEKTGFPQPSIFGSDLPTPKEWVGQIGIVSRGRGELTERGLKYVVACIKAMKEVLGDEVGLAIDGLQGITIQSCLRVAKAVEPLNLMWLEDTITGDYTPYTAVEAFRLVSSNTTTPIHTGEQIYLRQGFKALIEQNAIDVIGPDPCDVGGIGELKWIAEFADLHGVTIAPHGVGNGIIGAAALIQVCAAMPKNFIAFELPIIPQVWWELTEGFPKPLIKDGFAEIPERPGLGLELNEKRVRKHLAEGDDFFATKGK